MTFDTEGEMLAYRRVCDLLAKHPGLVDKLLDDAVKISKHRVPGSASRRLLEQNAVRLAKQVKEIIRNDILYWNMGE